MVLSVRLPRVVAIQNQRLALCHMSMLAALTVVLVYVEFVVGHGWHSTIPIRTVTRISWNQDASIEAMESFSDQPHNPTCSEGRISNLTRWGYSWQLHASCPELCNIDDVFTYEVWDANTSTLLRQCLGDFRVYSPTAQYTALQFMESSSQRDIHMITAKTDWVVNHAEQTREAYAAVVFEGGAALMDVVYKYELERHPPWAFRVMDNTSGTNLQARTLIVDSRGNPVGDPIPAGQRLRFSVANMLGWSRGNSQEALQSISTLLEYQSGVEIDIGVDCFGSDYLLNAALKDDKPPTQEHTNLHYGATSEDPICVMAFKLASDTYKLNVRYGSHGSDREVISEVSAIKFQAVNAHGGVQLGDFNQFLVTIASMLVVIGLPAQITSFFVQRCLGPISKMYRRTIVEPYNVEAQLAAVSTVLAANTWHFRQMCSMTPEGAEVISLATIHSIMCKAMEKRDVVLDDREKASLAFFLYKGIHNRKTSAGGDSVGLLEDIVDVNITFCGSENEEEERAPGITLDQWNQVRLDSERITFNAMVNLFDKDRPRNLFERAFTPPAIRSALSRAYDEEEWKKHHNHVSDAASRFLSTAHLSQSNSLNSSPIDEADGIFKDLLNKGSSDAGGDQPNGSTFSKVHLQDGGSSSNGLRSELEGFSERLRQLEQKGADLNSSSDPRDIEMRHSCTDHEVYPVLRDFMDDHECLPDSERLASLYRAGGQSGGEASSPAPGERTLPHKKALSQSMPLPQGSHTAPCLPDDLERRFLAIEASIQSLVKRTGQFNWSKAVLDSLGHLPSDATNSQELPSGLRSRQASRNRSPFRARSRASGTNVTEATSGVRRSTAT